MSLPFFLCNLPVARANGVLQSRSNHRREPGVWAGIQFDAGQKSGCITAEGPIMSSGIRRKTRRAFVCLVALVLLSSCHEGSHLQPSTLNVIPSAIPYFLTAGASVGLGNDAGHATISVKVQNIEGAPMQDVPVKFETDQGTIDPAGAMTLADGTARAVLTASVTATVMISTRTLSQKLLVTAQAPPGAGP